MKKRLIFWILICLFSMNVFSLPTIKYYRFIETDSRFNSYRTRNQIDVLKYKLIDCYQVKYDNSGRIMRILFLKKGKPANDKSGYCDIRFEYLDGIEKRVLYNQNAIKTVGNDEVNTYFYTLNDKNIRTSLINYNIKGNLIEDKSGCARYEWKFDEKGRKISETYWNLDGNQISKKNGTYETRFKWSLDDKEFNEESYWDKNGQLVKTPGSPSIFLRRYDKKWNNVEGRNLDENKHLIENKYGEAMYRIKYDSIENFAIEYKYFGIDEKLKEIKQGYAGITFKYNKLGNIVKQCYLGTDWKLKEINGTAMAKFEYNVFGNIIKYSYWGSNRLLKDNLNSGISIITYKYDDPGNLIEVKFFGMNEKLKERLKTGFAISRYKYDSIGNKIENRNFGIDDKLKEDSKGIAIIRWKYDKFGNIVEESHYGTDQLLLNSKKGTSIIRFNYDDNAQLVSTTYLDSNEKVMSEIK